MFTMFIMFIFTLFINWLILTIDKKTRTTKVTTITTAQKKENVIQVIFIKEVAGRDVELHLFFINITSHDGKMLVTTITI